MLSDQDVAAAFVALAHSRRVRLFRLLADNPEAGRSVTSLQHATGYKDAPLLHHLRIMERAGLVVRRRTGSTVSHYLRPGPLTAAMTEAYRLAGSAGGPARRAI